MENYRVNFSKRIMLFLFTCGIFIAMTGTSNLAYAADNNINDGIKVDGYYECEHPYIKELAVNITKNVTQNKTDTRYSTVKAIFKWMHSHITYEKPMYYNSKHYAVETAVLGKGNCCDQARLFIALCRAAGIPHNATKFQHSDAVQFMGGDVYGHVWPVVVLENGTHLTCDTSSCSSKLGAPTWKNMGSISETYDLKI
jgi:transglutaminase-like putative cysteine protease